MTTTRRTILKLSALGAASTAVPATAHAIADAAEQQEHRRKAAEWFARYDQTLEEADALEAAGFHCMAGGWSTHGGEEGFPRMDKHRGADGESYWRVFRTMREVRERRTLGTREFVNLHCAIRYARPTGALVQLDCGCKTWDAGDGSLKVRSLPDGFTLCLWCELAATFDAIERSGMPTP